jgi:hypothetical protein
MPFSIRDLLAFDACHGLADVETGNTEEAQGALAAIQARRAQTKTPCVRHRIARTGKAPTKLG